MTIIKKLPPLLIFPAEERDAAAMGRPSLRTPERVAQICAAIRVHGHSDTHAAARAGVSSSAVSRWREEDDEFALQLDEARAEYLEERLKEIRELRKRDGSIDWRAQAWLMQVAAPEVYGTPSRQHSLARQKEEKERAEKKAMEENPNVITPENLKRLQQWRAYSLYVDDGMGDEEARWTAHFGHDDNPPPFPGSLAIAGAEIPPPPKYTREEEAQLADARRRREVALRANAEAERKKWRELARERGEPVEDEEEGEGTTDYADYTDGGGAVKSASTVVRQSQGNEPAERTANDADSGASPSVKSVKSVVQKSCDDAEDAGNTDAAVAFFERLSRSRPECPPEADVPEGGRMQNTTHVPESRPAPSGQRRDGRSNGWGTPPPTKEHLAYLARVQAEHDQRRAMEAQNGAKFPESPGRGGGGAENGRTDYREMGVPQARRPLAGAALAAVEAKEWRRIHALMERQWERSTDRAMAAAEAASDGAMPGMWAGL